MRIFVKRRGWRMSAGSLTKRGFTLIEMLVAVTILAVIMFILSQIFGSISTAFRQNTGRAAAYASARAGFEAMRLNLSQATLNTYLAYADATGKPLPLLNPSTTGGNSAAIRALTPTQYLRGSELQFISAPASTLITGANYGGFALNVSGDAVLFQAPAGFVTVPQDRPLQTLLNVMGYYIVFGTNGGFAKSLPRYRLMEIIQPTENNAIYGSTNMMDANHVPDTTFNVPLSVNWIRNLQLPNPSVEHPLADNVIDLVILPRQQGGNLTAATFTLCPDYTYDSRAWASGTPLSPGEQKIINKVPLTEYMRNQLPPLVEIIMIAIDEPSAILLATKYNTGASPPFSQANIIAAMGGVNLSALFQDSTEEDTDLTTLQSGLNKLGVKYRIFRSDVAMHNALWSTN